MKIISKCIADKVYMDIRLTWKFSRMAKLKRVIFATMRVGDDK